MMKQKDLYMRVSFDLDSVIFDITPLYKRACAEFGFTYHPPFDYNIYNAYPGNVATRLMELFADDDLYKMQIISREYPAILNSLLQNSKFDVFFATQRRLKQPEKSFKQLRNAGINCNFAQVYDDPNPKIENLKRIKTDLHFDDSPSVVADCIRDGVNIVMISNENTPYNHHLRDRVKYYDNLKTALIKTGIIK